MVRNAFRRTLYTITLWILPNSKVGFTMVLIYCEKPSPVFRTHEDGNFIRKFVINLKTFKIRFRSLVSDTLTTNLLYKDYTKIKNKNKYLLAIIKKF